MAFVFGLIQSPSHPVPVPWGKKFTGDQADYRIGNLGGSLAHKRSYMLKDVAFAEL